MLTRAAQFALVVIGVACGNGPGRLELALDGRTMGTTYSVKIVAAATGESQTEIRSLVQAELDDVNRKMSTYLPESEVSRFNAHPETTAFAVSAETAEVVKLALAISESTEGALDVTVAPLVKAWGFGRAGETSVPSDEELSRLRAVTGWEKLELDESASALAKTEPELTCDLSSVAKGYAVDRVSEALAAAGYEDHMVEVGGEVRTSGHNRSGGGWRIGVEKPFAGDRAVHRILELVNLAMATSGDYRNYREQRGERLSHIIDPRTGRPIHHRLASATVVDERCARADGYATALMVLGEEDGYRVAVQENLAALLLVRSADGGFIEKATPRFEEMFS